MPTYHTVAEGECVETIAAAYGFFPDTLWTHSENAALREQRSSKNLLVEGDVVAIPPIIVNNLPCVTEAKHRFRRKGVPSRFSVRYVDPEGNPLANIAFRTIIDRRPGPSGKTAADGTVDIPVPPEALNLTLYLDTDIAWARKSKFRLSSLEPVSTIAGAQARLRSLDFFMGETNGEACEALTAAVRAFEAAKNLEPTGDHSSQLFQDALKNSYGC